MTASVELLLVVGMAGLVFGSFLNVCIVRLPADESIVTPRSRCTACKTTIPWYDNIPVLSWVLLRGRCRNCKEPVSLLYPLVELTVGLLWVAAVWWYGPTLTAITAAIFGTMLVGIAVTDARTYLIPDEYTLGGLGVGIILAAFGGIPGVLRAAIGAAVGFGLLYAVAAGGERLFKKEAMGGGDIKMMAMVGAFLGWQGVPLTIFGGALLGTIVFLPVQGIRSLIAKRRGQTASELLVPFGVFLAVAAAVTFVFGERMLDWYMDYIGG